MRVSTRAPDAPAFVSGPLDDEAAPLIPASLAQGVFGTYDGAQSRFAGRGARNNASVRAPAWGPQLPDPGDGSGGALTLQAERRIGERVMREIRQLKEARDMKSVGCYDFSMIDACLLDFEARYKEEREDGTDRI